MAINIVELFLKNEPGALLEVTELLESHGIDVYCISNSGEDEYIPVEMVLSHTQKAIHELAKLGYECEVDEGIALQIPNHPGGLNTALRPLSEEGINILSIFSAPSRKTQDSIIIIRVSDADSERAEQILKHSWINILDVDSF
jgi:hypothetical protein